MLNKILVENFKSHGKTEVDLNKLTLLVGTNSGGKSSIIQSLLLVIHNITNKNASPLNGHLVSVGTLSEVCNYISNANSFSISIGRNDEVIEVRFNPSDGEDAVIEYKKSSEELTLFLNYVNNNIHYLSANRIGGQDLYVKNFDRYDTFGLNGEYAIDYFEHHKRDILEKELLRNEESHTLEAQVNFWLEKFFDQRLLTSAISGTDKVKAEYKLPIGKNIRPKNMGSGISYLISIIIVCLASGKGDVIIIENPEIHLHPKAQSYLTDFLIFISKSGRQLIIETHSDHLFNGTRVAINQKVINKDDVAVHFFSLDEAYLTRHTKVLLNDEGKIISSVADLFDQFAIDLKTLVGF